MEGMVEATVEAGDPGRASSALPRHVSAHLQRHGQGQAIRERRDKKAQGRAEAEGALCGTHGQLLS